MPTSRERRSNKPISQIDCTLVQLGDVGAVVYCAGKVTRTLVPAGTIEKEVVIEKV